MTKFIDISRYIYDDIVISSLTLVATLQASSNCTPPLEKEGT